MPVDESEIEKRILDYIRTTSGMNDMPNRHNAIRDVTGQIEVLPSAVAKVITKMIEAGTIRHLKSNDKLELVE
jgi:DNA-binding MarR family transcriptional regulator